MKAWEIEWIISKNQLITRQWDGRVACVPALPVSPPDMPFYALSKWCQNEKVTHIDLLVPRSDEGHPDAVSGVLEMVF